MIANKIDEADCGKASDASSYSEDRNIPEDVAI